MKLNLLLAILLGLVLAAIGAGGGYWYAMRRMHAEPAPAPNTPTKAEAAAGRRVLYWHDPMVPGKKFDKPGKSPFMNMDLVPVYADEAGDEGKVTINPRATQNLGIRTAEVKEARMPLSFTVTGAVAVDERSFSAAQARVNGYIEKLYVRAQYDAVARGQPLADIYSPEWLAAQEEYLVLKRSTQPGAEALAHAARIRLALLGVSEAHIARIEQSGKPEPRVTLYAAEPGVTWEIGAREGMAVNPGMTLFRFASLDTVWVIAEVPEAEAALVRPGAPVAARAAALPEMVYRGTVAALLPDVNAATRTIRARIVLANPAARLKPGMFVTLELGGESRTMLSVPSEAVIYTGKRNVVIVAEDGGKFRPVEVEIGRDSGGMTEIRKGLAAGQKVVASGQFLIDSEASLKTTLARLEPIPAASTATSKPAHITASGRVERVDANDGTLELTHGPIPALKWPAMTMMFRAADKAVLGQARPGAEIEFDMLTAPGKDGDYIITRIAPLASRKPGAAK